MNLGALRKKYPRFFYQGYSSQLKGGDLHISFDFEVPALSEVEGPPDISFHPTVVIKNAPRKRGLENLIFHLGMMEIPSYWKATCSPEIVVEAGFLNKEQIAWWKDLILKGMGEFFYQNKIDFTQHHFLTITTQKHDHCNYDRSYKRHLAQKTLIPIGGGKDGVVTLELLKKANAPLRPFLLNPKPEQQKILGLAKVERPIVVERTLDPKLLELNRKGYLNGHTPFSAYLAFLTVLVAVLFDYKYIALSNEGSSNEGNVKYLGRMINHQYSKSFEFEKKFRAYAKTYLAKNVEYFSFLRPLYELQIARLFAKFPKYFGAFLSCNEANKTASGTKKPTGKWCEKCAKCLFVFLVLYPFAKKETLAISGRNLAEDKKLKPLLQELTGQRKFKPFECVGTAKESKVALALQKAMDHPILHTWNKMHFLPKKFEQILKKVGY